MTLARSNYYDIVARSATRSPMIHHLCENDDYITLCGRNREIWVVIRRASLSTDIDSPILCTKCRAALLR